MMSDRQKIQDITGLPEAYRKLLARSPDTSRLPAFDPSWMERNPVHMADSSSFKSPSRIFRYSMLVAAASLLVGLSLFLYIKYQSDPAQVATGNRKAIAVFLQGEVGIETDKGIKRLFSGDLVKPGEIIVTGQDGTVDLAFSEGSLVRVSPNGRLTIREFMVTDKSAVNLELKKGDVLSIVQRQSASDSFRITTPTAIAGVRGTTFRVSTTGESTRISLIEGSVEIPSSSGGSSVILRENDTAVVNPSSAPVVSNDPQMAEETKKSVVEMQENLKNVNPKVFQAAGELQSVQSEEDMMRIYKKDIEIIKLKSGRVFRGVVASQVDGNLLIQTVDGSYVIPASDVDEVLMSTDAEGAR